MKLRAGSSVLMTPSLDRVDTRTQHLGWVFLKKFVRSLRTLDKWLPLSGFLGGECVFVSFIMFSLFRP